MISRYNAILNDVPLGNISSDILILDIKYQAPTFQDDTFAVAKRNGARLVDRIFQKTEVSVIFEIHAYGTKERQSICNDIVRWAKNGGVLETNDRDGQYLQCVCTGFPVIESVKNWTDPLTITFTAYAYPFWQEKIPSTMTLTGTTGSGILFVPGNVDNALVRARIKANASLSSVELTVNGRILSLTGLSVNANQIIEISYDENAIQSIKVGSTSLLDKRSGVDDLLARCGERNTVAFSSNASADVTFDVKGMWL